MTHQSFTQIQARDGERGFTLVELAIVLIIIGLLIGGILKGQELIANAQIKSVVSQMKGFDAAVTTFKDSYGALPGDILNASNRLPNCAAATTCGANPGNGNGFIDSPAAGLGTLPGTAGAGSEGFIMWIQLSAADIVSGIQDDGTAVPKFADNGLPKASLGGGYWAGYTQTGAALALSENINMRTGHYFVLNGSAATVAAATGGLEPLQAERIDRTLDDGNPSTGTVRASGAGNCTNGNGATALYSNVPGNGPCGLYVRFQG
ncbi:MAG: prepilin-type N-terminal cleavage/methylation domain-containing protein [Rhodospirillales bacterium]|nr:prepilin-type N-terminal cleavage/methylation domain-containing protein [Rhodospirillales bacterium]